MESLRWNVERRLDTQIVSVTCLSLRSAAVFSVSLCIRVFCVHCCFVSGFVSLVLVETKCCHCSQIFVYGQFWQVLIAKKRSFGCSLDRNVLWLVLVQNKNQCYELTSLPN